MTEGQHYPNLLEFDAKVQAERERVVNGDTRGFEVTTSDDGLIVAEIEEAGGEKVRFWTRREPIHQPVPDVVRTLYG